MSKKAGRHSQSANDFLEPMVPTIDSASNVGTNRPYNDGAVTVSFTLPGDSPVATEYTVLSSGGQTATGSSSPITVTNLLSDTGYTFQVKATNNSGDSSYSTASSSVTVTTVPATPSAPSASSPNANQDEVSWSAPANGGIAITNYHWESDDGKAGDTSNTSVTVSQEAGTAQTYRVYATNSNGNSGWSSNSGSVTTTFSFAPFGVFGFSPFGVFGFSPFGVFGFSPFGVFGFSPGGGGCIDQDTLVAVVGPNDSLEYKMAKAINAGDEVWSATFDEYIDEDSTNPAVFESPTLTNVQSEKTSIMSIFPTLKQTTMSINGDTGKRFSLEENIMCKRNGTYSFITSGLLEVGDILIELQPDKTFIEVPIVSIDLIDEERTVYRFNAEPIDLLVAANFLVHNIKDRFNTRNIDVEDI